MNRYHKDVYIPEADKVKIAGLTEVLNTLKWQYTGHCTDNLKLRYIGLTEILLFIKGVKLWHEDVFEYYKDEKNYIVKLCYRISYTKGQDIIIVLSDVKEIITIYLNLSDDKHETLDKNLYVKN